MIMKNRQVELATKKAMAKERLKYYGSYYALCLLGAPIILYKTKSPAYLGKLFVMTIGLSFQYDMAYGTLLLRAREEAGRTIKEEPERFFLPAGSGICTQREYNKILGLPENYTPKIKGGPGPFLVI